jgi:hypothetical protein
VKESQKLTKIDFRIFGAIGAIADVANLHRGRGFHPAILACLAAIADSTAEATKKPALPRQLERFWRDS